VKLPKIPFSAKDLDTVIRAVPLIKDLFPDTKAGLNSLIQSDSELFKLSKKIKEQDEALYAKKQEIAVLEKKVETLEGIYKSSKRRTWKLEETIENCNYQINLLTKALTKED
jgi:septal ring factor EnvC (AmiA/AmiB activator)